MNEFEEKMYKEIRDELVQSAIDKKIDSYFTNRNELTHYYNVGKMSGSVSSLVVAKDASCEASVSLQSPDSLGRVKADMKLLEEDIRVPGCKVTSSIDLLFPTQERTEGNVKLYELVRDAGKMMDLLLPEGRLR